MLKALKNSWRSAEQGQQDEFVKIFGKASLAGSPTCSLHVPGGCSVEVSPASLLGLFSKLFWLTFCFCQLDPSQGFLGKGTSNEKILPWDCLWQIYAAFSSLITDKRRPSLLVLGGIQKQPEKAMSHEEEARKQYFFIVYASFPVARLLPWFPLIMDYNL